MKTKSFLAASLTILLALAGCASSNTATQITDPSNTQTATSWTTPEKLQEALSQNGYFLTDIDRDADDFSCKATNDYGTVEIDLQNYTTADQAMNEYEDDIFDAREDGYYESSSGDTSEGEYTLLTNDYNSYYALYIYNGTETLAVEDMMEMAQTDQIFALVKTIGMID